MKVELQKNCEVMKILRKRSYENFQEKGLYTPSNAGEQLERGTSELSNKQFPSV